MHGLNERQKEAVTHTKGPLLILAGAGAGKTRTIIHRIRHLIAEEGVNPSSILAITFTNKAAKEMRDRVERLLQSDRMVNRPVSMFERPFVSTFHGLGVHIIKENALAIGVPRHFSIFDRSDSLSAIKRAITAVSLDPKAFEPGRILHAISRYKGDGVGLEAFDTEHTGDYWNDTLRKVWEAYEKILLEEKALDFDDLLLKSVQFLRENAKARERYQDLFPYLHIDEYQDTNRVQYDMAKLLAEKHRNICVVGDIDQSIYSWRGADFKNIMRFEKDYSDACTILLEQNYRSTKNILRAANTVIAKNTLRKDKVLFTNNGEGERLALYQALDESDEARYVAEAAEKLIRDGTEPRQIGVLYRANFQSRALEEAFLNRGLPYQVLGTRFFERTEVKNVLSYLRAALNPESMSDIKRIINTPSRGIGKLTLLKLFAGEERILPEKIRGKVADFRQLLKNIAERIRSHKPSETVRYAIEESGLAHMYEHGDEEDDERLGNMFELVALSQKYDGLPPEEGMEQLLSDAALASDQDEMKDDFNGVKLMTVHASKGLEFDYVFITGLEENLFPHGKPDGERKNLEEQEEERRLFYVALTRARKKVFLSYTQMRSMFGTRDWNIPSSFLEDIDKELIEITVMDGARERGKIIYLE